MWPPARKSYIQMIWCLLCTQRLNADIRGGNIMSTAARPLETLEAGSGAHILIYKTGFALKSEMLMAGPRPDIIGEGGKEGRQEEAGLRFPQPVLATKRTPHLPSHGNIPC
jgi:hypothetical protein